MTTEILYTLRIKHEPGWLYYIDDNGNAVRTRIGKPISKLLNEVERK